MELNIDKEDLDEAMRRLHAAVEEHGSQLAFAKAFGLSHTIVSQVMRRRIDPPPQVLAAIKMHRVVRYEDLPEAKRRRHIQEGTVTCEH